MNLTKAINEIEERKRYIKLRYFDILSYASKISYTILET